MYFDLLAIDQNRIEGSGQEPSVRALPPVILGSDRPSELAQGAWERRPQHYGIKVTGMVGKVNALAGIWL